MEGHVFGCFATWHESNSFGHCAIMTACRSVAFPANYFILVYLELVEMELVVYDLDVYDSVVNIIVTQTIFL